MPPPRKRLKKALPGPVRRIRSGLRLSRIGLGTVQFGLDYGFTRAMTQGEVDALLDLCAERGVSLLDTARAYGDSEDKIGRFLRDRPGHGFVVATKLDRIAREQTHGAKAAADAIRASLIRSLQALGLERAPLTLLHQSEPYLLENPAFWEAVRQVREEGLFDAFGVVMYDPGPTEELLRRRPAEVDLLQVPYSVFDRRFEGLFPRIAREGMAVVTRSAFLKGVVTASEESLPDFLRGIIPYKRRLGALAERAGLTVGELALGFVLHSPGIDSTLIGAGSPRELEENLGAMSRGAAVNLVREELLGLALQDPALNDPREWLRHGFR